MEGEAQNFSNSQSLYRRGKTSITMSLRVKCSRLVATSPNTRTFETADSLQVDFGAYMEETNLAPRANRLESKEGEAQHFFKSQSLHRGRAPNFPKSQSLGGSSGVEFVEVQESI